MNSKVIAIDGPAGAGKSTTAKAVAGVLGLAHLDSGALYRAVTLVALNEGGVSDDESSIIEQAELHSVELRDLQGRFVPFHSGQDVSVAVRSPEVTQNVSVVSAMPLVRQWVTTRLRDAVLKHPRGAVADGRDVGSVVFPDAVLKIFLTANLDERARRRALEMEGPTNVERLKVEIKSRDGADQTRDVSPLVKVPDAILVDTSSITFEEQVAEIVGYANQWWDEAGWLGK